MPNNIRRQAVRYFLDFRSEGKKAPFFRVGSGHSGY